MTIIEMLKRNARMYPDAPALSEIQPGKKLKREITWKEFDERANRVANVLLSKGVKKGDKVIHLMMNSINWLEAYFGILKTGALAVPLNFRFICRQIKYCCDVAEAKVMMLDETFTERVEAIRSELSSIKDYIFVGQNPPAGMAAFENEINKAPAELPHIESTDNDECALYFTSGTTGEPKATLLIHKNLENAAIHENYAHRQTINDHFLLLQPLYHTGGKIHWFGSLIVGARCTMVVGEEKITPLLIIEAIQNEKITEVMLLVPWIQDMLAVLENEELRLEDYDLSSWRLMHSGAQPIAPTLIQRWKGYFKDVQYETNYGLTESSGPCIHMGLDNMRKLGSIGRPNLNLDARVVDDNDEDVEPGVVGELILRGNNVMKEYYKNPEKTAETLRNGWLHTGDMVKMDDEKFLYFVDRKKDIVISGGENIFPVEIEDLLHAQPKVHDAAVVGVPDERLGEIAIAIIEPKPGQTITEPELKEFYEPRLPKYTWPRLIFFDNVPRNPTGKIEKPKLRKKYADLIGKK
jgi:acyl-CoA synthetase (AMP-forming)/AMP-acid ligase II